MEMKRVTILTVAKMLNATKDKEGKNIATKVPVVAVGTKELTEKFLAACESVLPENEGLLPDQVCDVYNALTTGGNKKPDEAINTVVSIDEKEEQEIMEDPIVEAKKTKTTKKESKKTKEKKKDVSIKKTVMGVIATAVVLLKQTKEGFTKEELGSRLSKEFPEKKLSSLLATVGWQIGSRKGVFAGIEKLEDGKYRIV